MLLPARIVQICDELYELNKTLAHGTDAKRRQLTLKIAEQIRFELGDKWGTKSETATSPQSKDAIAYLNVDGSIDIWDWQNGITRKNQLHANQSPHYPNEAQFFISVNPVNHLGDIPIPGPDPQPPTDVVAAITEMRERIDVLQTTIANQNELITDLNIQIANLRIDTFTAIQNIKFPSYAGPFGLTFNPKQ